MTKNEMKEQILAAMKGQKINWEQLAGKIGRSPVWTVSACFGMNSMPEEFAKKTCQALCLGPEVQEALQECPHKSWDKTIPTDPVIYRFYEMIGVYGDSIKTLIHEKFGDGIMSAIDFSMEIDKVPDPKGDRVKVVLNGKFLPYKNW